MYKKLFLLIIGILLVLPLVNAGEGKLMFNYTFTDNSSFAPVDYNTCTINDSNYLNCTEAGIVMMKDKFINLSTNTNNATIEMRAKFQFVGSGRTIVFKDFNDSVSSGNRWFVATNVLDVVQIASISDGVNHFKLTDIDNTYHLYKFIMLMNNSVDFYVNGTYKGNTPTVSGKDNGTYLLFAEQGAVTVDWLAHYNGTDTEASDVTPPIVNVSINNTKPKRYEIINITANITDETGLSTANITINFSTGTVFMNYTITANGQISNATNITDIGDTVLNITFYATDTSSNVKQNSTLITVANSPPTFTSITGGAKEKEPFNTSLKLYLDFDDWNGTYIKDKTTNNNDGLIVGANRTYGKLGYGMVFDGSNDDITFSETDDLTSFTVGMWVYAPSGANTVSRVPLIGAQPSDDNWVGFNGQNHVLRMEFKDGTAIQTTNDPVMLYDQWVYLAYSYDSSNMDFYLNGLKQGDSVSAVGKNNSFNFIGSGYSTVFFNGTIDEVKIWNYSLSNTTIYKHFEQGMGNNSITTQTSLAVSVNASSDADNDFLVPKVEWYKNGVKNATSNYCLGHNNSVLCMPMDAPNTTGMVEDYSVQGNDGTIVGANCDTNNSKVGFGACEFDGVDDYVEVADSSTLDVTSVTLSMWIKGDTTIDDRYGKTGAYEFFYLYAGGSIQFAVGTAAGTSWTGSVQSNWNDGNWHMITGTYENNTGTIAVYVDAVQLVSKIYNNINGSITNTANDFIIGKGGGSGFINGTIDNVAIFNRSLSASEIKGMYDGELKNGLILNQSQTKKNEKWNTSIQLFDSSGGSSASINFSFDQIGNTIPNKTKFVNSSGLLRTTNQTYVITESYDPDKDDGIDTLGYYYYLDDVNPPVQLMNELLLNLTAYFPFNDFSGNTTEDKSPKSNDGECYGMEGTCNFADGYQGKGLGINNSNAYVGNKSITGLPTGNTPRTVMAWIYPKGDSINAVGGTPEKHQVIVGWGSPTVSNQAFLIERHNTNKKLLIVGWGNDVTFSTPLPVNTWTHIAVTNDGTTTRAYVNGTEETVSSGSATKTYNTADDELRIGMPSATDGWHLWFNGTIDEVKIYSRALTPEEIKLDYNKTKLDTNLTSDGTYFMQVKATDFDSNSSLSDVLNFTLDTVTPTDNLLTIISNLTFIRKNTNFTIQASDSNLEGHNVTAFVGDDMSGAIKFSTELINIGTATNDIKVEINISWGDGRYTIVSNESDDHNAPNIAKAIKRLRGLGFHHPETGDEDYDDDYVRLVFNKTINNRKINLSMWTGYYQSGEVKKLTKTQANNYNMKRLTYMGDEGYEFGFISKLPNNNFKFGFALEKRNNLRLRDNETAHFKWGREYYVDYDAEINGTPINPKIKETANFYGIYYTPDWSALGFSAEDVINFTTKSIGGVNLGGARTQVEIDTGLPQFHILNLSKNEISKNNSFINIKVFNLTYNVSDKNNHTVLAYVNGVKNASDGYISNKTRNLTITVGEDGNYTILIEINDSAGNRLNSTSVGVVVDTTLPIFVNASNRTRLGTTSIYDNTDVNTSIYWADVYLDRINISHNASNGNWTNHTITVNGNNTYELIINKNNLTANEIVGWKADACDKAGNCNDPINTFRVKASTTTTPAGDDISTAQQGTDDITPESEPETKKPIYVKLPEIWYTEKNTEIELNFYKDNVIYDPDKIEFEFEPYDYFIYRNLTKLSTGNYTAIFYTKSNANETDYTIIIKATSSPTEIEEASFEVKKSTIFTEAKEFIGERIKDVKKVGGKIIGKSKEPLTTWQWIVIAVAITITILLTTLISVGIHFINKKYSKKKTKDIFSKY